jgi:hypothetical protein
MHVSPAFRVGQPLTMVSTWDGDELSMVREHHQLRAARRLDVAAASAALDAALEPAVAVGLPVHGAGMYRVIHAGERGASVASGLAERGVRVRAYPGGRLAVVPGLDQDVARLGVALAQVLA